MLTSDAYTLRQAGPQYRAAIVSLLQAVQLPVEDLPPTLERFLVAEKDGYVIGSVGLEIHGDYALLRSMAIYPQHQGTGLGKALYGAAVDLALRNGIRELYLITTTAAPFFEKRGFQQADRAGVPLPIRETAQFTHICPSSGTVMWRSMP